MLSEPDVEAALLEPQLRWIAACDLAASICRSAKPASRRLPQHEAHGVEQVDGYPDASGVFHARRADPEHALQLEDDQRGRNDLPWMVHMLHRKAHSARHPTLALLGEDPEVLRRGHQPPAHPSELGEHRA